MENRLVAGAKLLQQDGVHITAIDEVESNKLGILLTESFPFFNGFTCVSAIINPSGQQGKNFSTSGEYYYFQYYDLPNMLNKENRDEDSADVRNFMNGAVGEGGNYLRETGKNCFYSIIVKDNKVIGFGDVCPDDFHPVGRNVRNGDYIYVYPVDNKGIERKWLFERGTVQDIKDELSVNIRRDGDTEIIRTKLRINYKTIWTDSKYNAKEHGTKLLSRLFGSGKSNFSFPKSIYSVQDCVDIGVNSCNGTILDYFAGSGTTGHAVINLNREDGGSRKYILCEMGEYFDTVTKPRIQKVIYSKDWDGGKPVSREGSSHCFKYIRLEQYEDTLNNLTIEPLSINKDNADFYGGYMLGYMLDIETRGSLFNMQWFRNPWNMKLHITRQNETREENVDVIETFNYLIGLNVKSILYPKKDICTIEGVTRSGERTLVIWRNCNAINNEALDDFFRRMAYSTRDTEFDRIYVNGDNNLENLLTDENQWKVILTEQEFAKRMFEDC